MPNVTISIYLTDEEYLRYVPKKTNINETVRDIVKKAVKK